MRCLTGKLSAMSSGRVWKTPLHSGADFRTPKTRPNSVGRELQLQRTTITSYSLPVHRDRQASSQATPTWPTGVDPCNFQLPPMKSVLRTSFDCSPESSGSVQEEIEKVQTGFILILRILLSISDIPHSTKDEVLKF